MGATVNFSALHGKREREELGSGCSSPAKVHPICSGNAVLKSVLRMPSLTSLVKGRRKGQSSGTPNRVASIGNVSQAEKKRYEYEPVIDCLDVIIG
jgi:hypothetical protein